MFKTKQDRIKEFKNVTGLVCMAFLFVAILMVGFILA